jgi:hypothetical protein
MWVTTPQQIAGTMCLSERVLKESEHAVLKESIIQQSIAPKIRKHITSQGMLPTVLKNQTCLVPDSTTKREIQTNRTGHGQTGMDMPQPVCGSPELLKSED